MSGSGWLPLEGVQYRRFQESVTTSNATMAPKEIQAHCVLNKASQQLLKIAINDLNLSARAYDRILRVARTIADLEGVSDIAEHHLSEAIQYRSMDRPELVRDGGWILDSGVVMSANSLHYFTDLCSLSTD